MIRAITTLSFAIAAILLVVIFSVQVAFAAGWAYEEDFEGLTTGSLGGQDSWSTASSGNEPQVVNTLSAAGSQSLLFNVDSLNRGPNTRSITPVTDDGSIFYISMRADKSGTGDNARIILFNGGSVVGQLSMNGSGSGLNFDIRAGGAWQTIQAMSIDTWYRFGCELDFTNNRYRFNVDGGAFGSWYSFQNSSSQVNKLYVDANDGFGGPTNFYFDEISATYATGGAGGDAAPPQEAIMFLFTYAPLRPFVFVA